MRARVKRALGCRRPRLSCQAGEALRAAAFQLVIVMPLDGVVARAVPDGAFGLLTVKVGGRWVSAVTVQ